MARVDNPRSMPDGMLCCKDCPLEGDDCIIKCVRFSDGKLCPTPETYQEAIELAEQEAAK